MDLTPEQCFERAVKLLKRGNTDKAIKLLQIATLRAPDEARYQEALNTARRMKNAPQPAVAPIQLETASAEYLYKQALKFKKVGNTARATQFMQVAVARAPAEARYREALEQLRQPASVKGTGEDTEEDRLQRAMQMSNFDEVERLLRESLRQNRDQPEKLLLLSLMLLRIRNDAKGALGPIRESVRLAPKILSALILQEEVLRALGDRSEAAKAARAIRDISTSEERLDKARRRLDDQIIQRSGTSSSATQTITATRNSTLRIAQMALLGVLLAIMGGLWYDRQPDNVSTSPYTNQLPVISAISPNSNELIVRIEEPMWVDLQKAERESRLHSIMAEASTHGFESVFVHNESGRLLGSVRGGMVFLPR